MNEGDTARGEGIGEQGVITCYKDNGRFIYCVVYGSYESTPQCTGGGGRCM